MSNTTQNKTSTDVLFTQYINTCNTAIDRHRSEFPFKQMLDAASSMAEDKNFGIGVYKNEASKPHDYFTVKLDDGKISIVSHGKEQPNVEWSVKESFLEHVVENPQEYIEHPMKLEWDWMKTRLNVS